MNDDKIVPFPAKGDPGQISSGGLSSGGGGGNYGDMEKRVETLEKKFDRIELKLDSIGNDLAYIKGKIEGLPSASAFGELKGRVDSLPTTARVATLLSIAVAVITIAARWVEITALFR